jgi:cytochrome c556
MRRLRLFPALISLLFCLSCAKAKPEAEYRPTTTIKDLMEGMVDPAADTIWNSVATTITTKGKVEKAPYSDEEWATVRGSAIQLLEASNLLQIPGRHVAKPGQRNEQGIELQPEQIETLINQDRQAWITLAHGLHDAASLAVIAANAKDPAKVLESGEQIDNACERCHETYWYPHPAQSHSKWRSLEATRILRALHFVVHRSSPCGKNR